MASAWPPLAQNCAPKVVGSDISTSLLPLALMRPRGGGHQGWSRAGLLLTQERLWQCCPAHQLPGSGLDRQQQLPAVSQTGAALCVCARVPARS